MTGHHVGMKCTTLREYHMHVKLSVSTYVDLLNRLPVLPSEEIPLLDQSVYPTFVHVLGAVPQPRKYPLSMDE